VPPTCTFLWTGTDPDGLHGRFPVSYKFKLFRRTRPEYSWTMLRNHPDSLRVLCAPAFAGWDSLAGDTCRFTIEGLTPGAECILAVVAFDEAGAYSPVFSYNDGNLLEFSCSYVGASGPILTVWNDYFSHTGTSSSYSLDPTTFIPCQVPGGRAVQVNWSAKPRSGSEILAFRWALDLETIDDPTPRSDENTDWRHWSRSGTLTQATVGPFVGTSADSIEQHLLYIEAEDTNHLKSLAVVTLRVIRNSGERPLLIVNDTRFVLDRSASTTHPDSVIGPAGIWPTSAELDTFLCAIGGVRWRCYVPPALSPAGIFAGYDFDTLSTRRITTTGNLLLALSRYRNVIWFTDPAQEYTFSLGSTRYPMTLLRGITMGGTFNPLLAFAESGGGTWYMGGGFAFNALYHYNTISNDVRPIYPYTGRGGMVFSAAAGEIAPGRMLYHDAHWRSEISMKSPARAARPAGLVARPGGPDWSLLPAELREKTPGTDALPPMRTIPSLFYQLQYPGEVITQPDSLAGLDTLYVATGGDLGTAQPPVMTCYRGPDSGPCVFSGFPLWYFQRAQAIQLLDFVLQQIWHLPRQPVAR
jgi:hypothetical protein